MHHRDVKDRLYGAWAETAKALASPKRVEILDLLAQGERAVEALARETGLTINNTSSHLTVLKAARLVDTRKAAQFVFYRLADDGVVGLLHAVQATARQRLHEVDHLARTYLEGRDSLEPVTAAELRRRMRCDDVIVIDVRPSLEYEAGHIRGALSVPLDQLETRAAQFPSDRSVVAYCRGPYCVYAVEAVERLRLRGHDARRFADGFPDWRIAGHPTATGPEQVATPQPEPRTATIRRAIRSPKRRSP